MIGTAALGLRIPTVKQRPAAGEAIFDAVPKTYRRFAELPAKKHHFRTEHARKIDESLLDAFTYATVSVDRLDPLFHLRDQSGDFPIFAQPIHQVRGFGIELLLANYGFAGLLQSPDIFENLFDQRPDDRQHGIGFIDGEQSLGAGVSIHGEVSCYNPCQR